ncbi:MAG: hypothetical protein R3286_18430 [Gammaproteobacteria bacterium]|nr:hypothetical protein [Gammaproteobacteria bacterium]
MLLGAVSLLAGCAAHRGAPMPAYQRTAAWDPAPAPPPCRAGRVAPLVADALLARGLDGARVTISAGDLESSHYARAGVLDDSFRLSWFREVFADPARLGCFEGRVAHTLDGYLDAPHTVAGVIRHAARWLDRDPGEAPPYPSSGEDGAPASFDAALARLCEPAAGDPGETGCGSPHGRLPADLAAALAPVMWAIGDAVAAQRAQHEARGLSAEAEGLRVLGGNFLYPSALGARPDLRAPSTADFFLGVDRAHLYAAAARLAFAIEDVDWARFRGRRGIAYELRTPLGRIRVHDAAAHVHRDGEGPVLLGLDLGGDDLYLGAVAANGPGNPVSIAIDLAGSDVYRYPESRPSDDGHLLAPDEFGRFAGNTVAGAFSLSLDARQGAARNGVAMLFDLGTDDDHYQSLRMSQGYAHLGVGVLYDAGGNDRYLSEAASQGAALFGIGLAIDAGAGDDLRRAFAYSQGFAYVGGFGLLLDGGGDDVYECHHGQTSAGGRYVYPSSQMRGEANQSMCQGAAQGLRDDARALFASGGLGILRDVGGDDIYEAGLFAQGSGYWQAVGILSDGAGNDHYDAFYYAQGGSAHYAIGLLADDGDGDDRFNTLRAPRFMQLGAGHDYAVGVLINEGGDDVYRFAGLAVGASNCNGIGIFVDNGGDDSYRASSDYGSGMGNVSEECLETRSGAVSIGIMIDAGGDDRYEYPPSTVPAPANGDTWGHRRHGLPTEYGIGVDGDGDSGIHPGG